MKEFNRRHWGTDYGIRVHLTIGKDRMKDLHLHRSYSPDIIQLHLDEIIFKLKFNPKIEEIMKKAKSIAVLEAHGYEAYSNEEKWKYADVGCFWTQKKSVQKWVDKYDGKFDVLFIKCCNSEHKILRSKKSVLIWPSDTLSEDTIVFHSDSLNISDSPVA